jgi:hypothetical protein
MGDGNSLDFDVLKVDFPRCAQIRHYIVQLEHLINNNHELNFIIPCSVSQSPDIHFDAAENTVLQLLKGTGTMELATSSSPYYDNNYWEDHQEYLEER